MANKTFILQGFDDAAGAKLYSLETGRCIRETHKTYCTGDTEKFYSDGEYIWAQDDDSTIAVFTGDLVELARVDIGYRSTIGQFGKPFHIEGGFLYILTTANHDNEATADTQNQLVIRKFDKLTLVQVAQMPITDPLLWDGASFQSLNKKWIDVMAVWLSGHICIPIDGGTDWAKVSLDDGSVVSTWVAGPSDLGRVSGNNEVFFAAGILPYGSNRYMNAPASIVEYADFNTFTLGVSAAYDINTAAIATGLLWDGATSYGEKVINEYGDSYYSQTQRIDVDFVGGTFKTIYKWQMNDGTAPGQTNYYKLVEVTVDLNTGAVTFSAPVSLMGIQAHDDAAKGRNALGIYRYYDGYFDGITRLPDGRWFMIKERYGFSVADFSAGTFTVTGEPWQQGYSGDAPYFEGVAVITLNETAITSTVTQSGAPAVGRAVHLYDELTGVKIDSTVTNGSGSYTLKKHSNRKVFAVAAGSSNTENFKINAHL